MTTFTTAINQAPSILFIDELDAFYRRDHESGSLGGYNVGVVTGLLTEIDRARATPGLILIAATNHPDHVDPAVIRPGRFDLHFQISTLNRAEISALIQSSIKVPPEDDAQFNLLLERLIGATGAEIQNILRQAAARGRDQAAKNVIADLVAIAGKMRPAPDPELVFRCAIHEAGHLIVGHLLNCPEPIFARLTSEGGEVISKPRRTHTNQTIAADLTCLMAGRAAEIIVFGAASSGGGTTSASDLAKASSMALAAEVQWGFGEGPTPLWQPVNDPATFWRLSGEAKVAAQRRIALAEANARQLLSGRQDDLEAIAKLLIKHRELDQAGLEKALHIVTQSV